ncbi:MAG: YdgA family protein [Burkholderiales bacterium]|nr:YdgA family protein [Burkholderiales bacterium]MBI3728777.1 YdgA family protein [Burkholderiales bacterium]
MSKSIKLIAVVVVLAVAYPAAAWYTGKSVEAKLAESSMNQAKSSPYVKVVKQEYQRGIFTSVQDTTLELNLTNFPGMQKPDFPVSDAAEQPSTDTAVAAADAPPAEPVVAEKVSKPIQIHFINRIQHGPLPAFRGYGAALIKTELVLDAESKAQLAKVFGTANPLEITSRLNYGGSGRVSISSPAFNTVMEKDKEKVTWQGLSLEIGFEKDYKAFNVVMNAPGLTVDGLEGQSFKMGAVSLTGEVTQAYPGTNLYLGKTGATIANISYMDKVDAKKSFNLDQLKLSTDASMKDELVDIAVRLGGGKLSFDQQEFSDFHYDYGLKRIHGPSLAKISTAYSGAGVDPEKLAALKALWDEVAPLILQKEPELVLERLSVVTTEGEAKLSGSAKLVGATAADAANPMMLLPKLQSNLDVTLTEALLAKLGGARQKDPEMQKAALDAMNQQIQAFEGQGYITRSGKLLSSKIEWKQGQLTVNGKPFSR